MNYQNKIEIEKFSSSFAKRFTNPGHAMGDLLCIALRVSGAPDIDRLQDSVKWLVYEHPALRLRLVGSDGSEAGGESRRIEVVDGNIDDINIDIVDNFVGDNCQQYIQNVIEEPFLFGLPLLRLRYFRNKEKEDFLVVCFHRIIIDEGGIAKFVEMLVGHYNTLITADDPLLPLKPLEQDSSFLAQKNFGESAVHEGIASDLTFWKGALEELEFSDDESISMSRESRRVDVHLDRPNVTRLSGWCLDNLITMADVIAASWQAVLQKSLGESSIALQVKTQGMDTLGLCNSSDMLVLPGVENEESTAETIRSKGLAISEARRHLNEPFDNILDRLEKNNPSGTLQVKSLMRFTMYPTLGFNTEDGSRFYMDKAFVAGENNGGRETISANLYLREGRITGSLAFDGQVYELATIHALWNAFCDYVNCLGDLPISTVESDGSSGEHELHVMFEHAAREYGERVALIDQQYESPAEAMTYRQLNEASNRLANTLIDRGVRPGDTIGVHCDRSPLNFVALLAIWKAGAVYVPLDVVQSNETLRGIVRQSQPALLLTNRNRLGVLRSSDNTIPEMVIESVLEDSNGANTVNPNCSFPSDRPSLLLFTSGSTGTPKGVLHRQRQLINRFQWLWRNYPFEVGEVACQRTNMGYQPSLWEMLGGLLKGVPTVILHDDIVKDPYLLKQALIDHRVTHLTLVPSLLQLLLQDSEAKQAPWNRIRICITAGEPLKVDLLRAFTEMAPNALLLNDYGSTETNGVLYFDSRDFQNASPDRLPGFRTIDNVTCHVLDEGLQPITPGDIGGLYIGGESLAIEYLDNPELTADKFIFHQGLGCRLYCIGDLARVRTDGTLEVLGRADNQVKIRGNRVELEGVENILQGCEGVVDCAVGVRTLERGSRNLVAHVVLQGGTEIDAIRAQLEARLPDYMHPSFYHQASRIPRNANGKVDRSQINEDMTTHCQDDANTSHRHLVNIRSAGLDHLIRLSADILEVSPESIDPRRKFYEIGFDSTSIVLLVQRMKSELNVDVRVAELYNMASLSALAKHIGVADVAPVLTEGKANKPEPVTPIEHKTDSASILETLQYSAAQLLELPVNAIGVHRKFYELGFDSGAAAEYIQIVNRDLGVGLRIKDLYANATLQDLALYIEQSFVEQLRDRQAPAGAGYQSNPVNEVQSESERTEVSDEAIAIIGMSGCYSHYHNLSEFWQGLANGECAIREVPPDRWNAAEIYGVDGSAPGVSVSKWGGFLDGADRFDAEFFGIMPAEALYMDPQQRLSLQESWRTFENAGYAEERIEGKAVGVFVGHRAGDYAERVRENQAHADAFTLMGNDSAVLAARIAYHLNLKGPCISLDTACSSSLVAIHLACQSLRSGECEMALAGGVCVLTTPTLHQQSTKLGMLTAEGKCKTFDNRADGFVPGEGAGFVLLKPLAKAQQDGDVIHAVVLGSGVNQDGRTNGMTAPNAQSQQALMEKVYRDNHIDPGTIGLVETHGTGTKLGDPIEFEALKGAYCRGSKPSTRCALGAVKTNIGHTIAAAGIAGLHKAILAMQRQQIPPTANFDQINEHIDLEPTPFFINTSVERWQIEEGQRRRAAVSSFGFSGTNAHLVVEECDSEPVSNAPENRPYIIALSAQSKSSLGRKVYELASFLEQNPSLSLADIEMTLLTGRSHYIHRLLLVASGVEGLIAQLRSENAQNQSSVADACQGLPGKFITLAEDYLAERPIIWERFNISQLFGGAKRIALPTYPFDEKRFWLDYQPSLQEKLLSNAKKNQDVPAEATMTARDTDAAFLPAVENAVREVIQVVTGRDANSLKTDDPLEKIGIGSVMILMLNKAMKDRFGPLPDTLFYENQSIGELARCLAVRFRTQTEKALSWESAPIPSVASSDTKRVRAVGAQPVTEAVDTAWNKVDGGIADIAIVGLSGRYPEAEDIGAFWRNLCEGKDCITEIPRSRWTTDEIYQPGNKAAGFINSKWGGFLSDVDAFDPLFFNISPKDAQLQDPQERLFLQTAWHALEDAGYCKQTLANHKAGVFVGVVWGEYQLFGVEEGLKGHPIYPNSSFSSIANRVSYCLNLKGPSMAVDTMCSSSLTAIHLACQSINSGECDVAIAGGVNLSLHPTKYQLLAQGRFLSSDGHCRSFGEGGDGYVPGEGVGAVVVKSLARAVNDGDHIYAVIKGSALNHGGKTNGYTVPNPNAQGQLVKDALRRAKIDPGTISYIEAHGTGTELGDPIEIAGLLQAFPAREGQRCAIGSVKSNIGHLEAAAGIAGLTKILLQMKHGLLVPSLLAGEVNHKIDFGATPFDIQTHLEPWQPEPDGAPRRAAISAFGAGGSNAHLILEAYEASDQTGHSSKYSPSVQSRDGMREPHIVILSARQEYQLRQQVEQLNTFLLSLQKPQGKSEDIADCVRGSLAEVLGVGMQDIDLHDTLEDYINAQFDLEQFIVKINSRLSAPLQPTLVDTRLPLRDLVKAFPESCAGSERPLDEDEYSLTNIAFTLQMGREPFEHRVAFIVHDMAELVEQLDKYLAGNADTTSVSGDVLSTGVDISTWLDNSAGQEFVKQLVGQNAHRQIAKMWTVGVDIDWRMFYPPEIKPKRVSLPLYPFDKTRYWFDQASAGKTSAGSVQAWLHPLLHSNCSNLYQQRFETNFSTQAFYLNDHRVGSDPTLPGVAYLEMMLAALEHSLEDPVYALKNVVFIQPITVAEFPDRTPVFVKVVPEDAVIDLRVESKNGDLYAKSRITWSEPDQAEKRSLIDLDKLNAQVKSRLDSEQCYDVCLKANMHYGTSFRVLDSIEIGDDFAIGTIQLPGGFDKEEFRLHPAVMDGGLQTLLVLMDNLSWLSGRRFLPYSIQKLSCYSELPHHCRAIVRSTNESRDNPAFDVDYLNESSEVVVSIQGLVLREANAGYDGDKENRLLYYRNAWKHTPLQPNVVPSEPLSVLLLLPRDLKVENLRDLTRNIEYLKSSQIFYVRDADAFHQYDDSCFDVNIADPRDYETLFSSLKECPCCVVSLAGLETSQGGDADRASMGALLLAQAVAKKMPAQRETDLIFMYTESDLATEIATRSSYQALGGLAKTVRIENPNLQCRVVGFASNNFSTESALTIALDEYLRGETYVAEVRYSKGRREIRQLEEVVLADSPVPCELQSDAVVLITGGMGKLGLICAEWVFEHQHDAVVILCGRSQPADEAQQRIQEWRTAGKTVEIALADITSVEQATALVERIVSDHGKLTGIVHCAGSLRDAFLIKKSAEDIDAVLSPKLDGAYNLDTASKGCALDYFIMFSSIAAILGNPGQSDYAYANSYLDAYAEARNVLVENGQRCGRSLSINWPLWANGGMKMDPQTQKRLREQWGVVPLPDDLGLSHLSHALEQPSANFVFVYGHAGRLRESMHINSTNARYGRATVATPKPQTSSGNNGGGHTASAGSGADLTLSRAKEYVTELLSGITKVPADQFDDDAGFDRYGVDSVVIADLNSAMESRFKGLPQTLFFEYQSINALAQFLCDHYPASFADEPAFGESGESGSVDQHTHKADIIRTDVSGAAKSNDQPQRFLASDEHGVPALRHHNHDDIAIIGMSGRYPMANSLAEFWENLVAGRDCIQEVPKERWDSREYFDTNPGASGKTHSKWGGFIEDVDKFDPMFFGISPAEAEQMDPQERICIELVWQALEDAGYTRASLKRTKAQDRNMATGLFIGCMYKHYPWLARNLDAGPFLAIGSYWNITNRISYLFDLQGPSIAVDTACASSLTAVHMACENIRQGNCTTALAGGVNLSLHPDKFVGLSESGMLSAGSKSRGLGRGDGYVSGEGAGMVLLKPLSMAELDGDHIYAVIKGSAINHGGKSNSFATPNPRAQSRVAEQALHNAAVDADQITYVETASNGAELGDMIEFNALDQVYRNATAKQHYCAIGTVKSNVGHLEAASGISQLTKVVLQLKHKIITPTINAEPLNEKISLEGSPFRLQSSADSWLIEEDKSSVSTRYAAINSIGAGGANAHVIVAEYGGADGEEEVGKRDLNNSAYPILLSARSLVQIGQQAEALAACLEDKPYNIIDVSYTLSVGREFHNYRLASFSSDREKLIGNLRFLAHKLINNVTVADSNEIEANYAISMPGNVNTIAGENGRYSDEVDAWLGLKSVDWFSAWKGQASRRVALPTYPFERGSYWIPGFSYGDQALLSKSVGEQNDSATGQKPLDIHIQDSGDESRSELMKIQAFLRNELSSQLKVAPEMINFNQDLVEIGFDSLQGMKFLNRVQRYCTKKLIASELIGVSTIAAFSNYLIENGCFGEEHSADERPAQDTTGNTGVTMESQLDKLLERLESGEISPDIAMQEEALIQQQLLENKL